MFTGIILGLGTVVAVTDREKFREIVVDAGSLITSPAIGASVAVSGVCLTVTSIEGSKLSFEAMEETLKKTTTGDLKVGDEVNIETPLHMGDELGGHFVLGHVDGIGEIISKTVEGENTHMTFRVPENLARYIVDKGSIAIDGISLTICNPCDLDARGATKSHGEFDVWLLPLTLQRTTLGFKNAGDTVNLEADYLLKAVLKNQ